jgi:hypothetical protein
MAKKTIIVSDVSGQDVPDDEQVELRVLELEGLSQPIRLDASKAEADRLRLEAKPMALIELVMPDGTVERVAIDAAEFKKSIKGDADEVMSRAEALSFVAPAAQDGSPRRRGRRPRAGAATAARTDKVDYASEDHFGMLHRGRVTEEEAAMVRGNLDRANVNRASAGQRPIDPNDYQDKKRYGFKLSTGPKALDPRRLDTYRRPPASGGFPDGFGVLAPDGSCGRANQPETGAPPRATPACGPRSRRLTCGRRTSAWRRCVRRPSTKRCARPQCRSPGLSSSSSGRGVTPVSYLNAGVSCRTDRTNCSNSHQGDGPA